MNQPYNCLIFKLPYYLTENVQIVYITFHWVSFYLELTTSNLIHPCSLLKKYGEGLLLWSTPILPLGVCTFSLLNHFFLGKKKEVQLRKGPQRRK